MIRRMLQRMRVRVVMVRCCWRGSVAVEEERLIESSVLLVLIAQMERSGLKGEHAGQRSDWGIEERRC